MLSTHAVHKTLEITSTMNNTSISYYFYNVFNIMVDVENNDDRTVKNTNNSQTINKPSFLELLQAWAFLVPVQIGE